MYGMIGRLSFRRFVLLVLPFLFGFGFARSASAALTGTLVASAADVVSPGSLSPDGQPDFNIKVTGLRSIPTVIQIVSDTNGVWVAPFNGVNWQIGLLNSGNGAAELYFSQCPSSTLTVAVQYADGTTDQTTVVMQTV